jgi:nitrite reductase/ring-hydroxylating ferredoxin subunit
MSRLICASSALVDGGDGVRFKIDTLDGVQAAFVLRWQGNVVAYLNRCAHVALELDWNPGKFLDADGEYLICAAHGALYAPESGECVAGPCRGKALQRLRVLEQDGNIYVEAET